MQLELADLPEFPPRHRIGIKNRGRILPPDGDGAAGVVLMEGSGPLGCDSHFI